MYNQKIGFHIMTANAANSPWVGRFKSAVHLVLAIGVGGEVPRLLQLAQAHPNSRFIYRAWTYGQLGQSDYFPAYFREHGADPLPLIRAHEPVFNAAAAYGFNNRISYQLFNETGHDEEIWPHFVEFNRRFIVEMDRRGLSAAVLGLGPGHPAWAGPDARTSIRNSWTQARPLFEAIAESRETHIVNLHEYHAFPWTRFEPWVIGRFRWMIEDVRAMGIPTDKIKVVIGESGFTDPNALNYPSPTGANGIEWSIAQGKTPAQLAEDYADMVNNIYLQHPNLLGLCYYSLGSDPGWWQEFDLLRFPSFLERLEQLLVHNPPTEEPVPEVTDTPLLNFVVLPLALNVRPFPSLSSIPKDKVLQGEVIATNGVIQTNGYQWRRRASDGGFCAEFLLSDPTERFLTEKVAPTWKETVRTKLEQIETLAGEVSTLVDQA